MTGEGVCESFGADTVQEGLKDGLILCKLINVLRPGSVKKTNTSKMAFKMVRTSQQHSHIQVNVRDAEIM